MTDAQTLRELIERCEAATGPDRELDGLVWQAFHVCQDADHWHSFSDTLGHKDHNDTVAYELPPRLTGSTDSALAFMRGVLQQGIEYIDISISANYSCAELMLRRGYAQDRSLWRCDRADDHAALAIIIVTLRARLAEMEASSE